MKFVVKTEPLGFNTFTLDDEEYDRREDARLAAERYSGKILAPVLVIEYDDAGNEIRIEEYDPEEGWLSDIGRKRP